MSKETAVAVVEKSEREVAFVPFGARDEIKLNITLVRRFMSPRTKSGAQATDEDCMKFIMLCKARGLNPWEGDAFLQGYDSQDGPKFSLITAHQAFLKRAEINKDFDGMESGVVTIDEDGELKEYQGDFVLPNQTLVGGWARVFKKSQGRPIYKRLKLGVFDTGLSRWKKDPAGMIVKCSEADALRTAFPTAVGALYIEEETKGFIDISEPERPEKVKLSMPENRQIDIPKVPDNPRPTDRTVESFVVQECGRSFDDLKRAIQDSGWPMPVDTWSGFWDISAEDGKKLLNAQHGLRLKMGAQE